MRLSHREPERTDSQSDGWTREAAREAEADRRRAEPADDMAGGDAVRRDGAVGIAQAAPTQMSRAWQEIKSRFVDDPAGAVAAAEDLVRRTFDDRIRALRSEAAAACGPERDDEEPSTEAMRRRLQRCQAYCEQLAARMTH